MSISRQCTLLLVGISTAATGQTATDFHNLDALDAQIAAALGAPAGAPGGAVHPLDRRLHLAACHDAIAVSPVRQGAVTVSCGTDSWRIRVAVLPTAAQSASTTDASPDNLPQPVLVARGDQVRASIIGIGFRVSTAAIAEENGGLGQRIRIRIDGKSRSTYAVVTSPGNVQL